MNRFKELTLGLFLGTALLSTSALAEDPKIMVYKSPTCGCCTKWVSHLKVFNDKIIQTEIHDKSGNSGVFRDLQTVKNETLVSERNIGKFPGFSAGLRGFLSVIKDHLNGACTRFVDHAGREAKIAC